jgi:hypothetical protein
LQVAGGLLLPEVSLGPFRNYWCFLLSDAVKGRRFI